VQGEFVGVASPGGNRPKCNLEPAVDPGSSKIRLLVKHNPLLDDAGKIQLQLDDQGSWGRLQGAFGARGPAYFDLAPSELRCLPVTIAVNPSIRQVPGALNSEKTGR
jgi:hypothetical protein